MTFDSNGGSAVSSQTVDSGSMATEPTSPTRDGYTYSRAGITAAPNTASICPSRRISRSPQSGHKHGKHTKCIIKNTDSV
ncbi:MAG: InlB B-repeat-containing protein [Firmicutes bacterium]|nr:InlB B-repeat-containing protein [Bacillota bacterium]